MSTCRKCNGLIPEPNKGYCYSGKLCNCETPEPYAWRDAPEMLIPLPPGKVVVVTDTVAEKLDEMADLCEHWKRHRERGRKPTAIRAALMMLAAECTALERANVELTGAEGVRVE